MSVEAEVLARLKAHADVAASLAGRIFPDELPEEHPESDLPAAELLWEGSGAQATLSGPDALETHQLECTVWALSSEERADACDDVRRALVHWPPDTAGYTGRICDIEDAGYESGKDEGSGWFWRTLAFKVTATPETA